MGSAPVGNEPPPTPRSVPLSRMPQFRAGAAIIGAGLVLSVVLGLVGGVWRIIGTVIFVLALGLGAGSLFGGFKIRELLTNGTPAVATPLDQQANARIIAYSYEVGQQRHSGKGMRPKSAPQLDQPGAGLWVVYDPDKPAISHPWTL